MARKLTLVLTVAIAGAAIAGWAVAASAAKPSKAAPSQPTATFVDHTVSSHNIDNGKPGFGPGDQFVSHDVLKQNGNKVGTLDSICETTALYGHGGFFGCTAGAKLDGGQIVFQGALHFGGSGNPPFDIGIVGGTGQYRTARGYAHVTPIKGTHGNDSRVQLYLVP
jgi:allene oxide cyclase-like protein